MLKVSIITTSYNSEETIASTLHSVRIQTYPHIEHICVDGGSTDHTLSIIKSFDNVTRWVSEPDKGIYNAMNKGLSMATGDLIAFLNSDDWYASADSISKAVELIEKEDADVFYSDLVYVHHRQIHKVVRTWQAGPFRRKRLFKGWIPPHPTFILRRKVYETSGRFNEAFLNSADYDLMLRVLLNESYKVVYLPEVFIKMRTGGMSNASLQLRLRANKEDYQCWKNNGFRLPWLIWWMKPLRKLPQFLIR